MGPDLVKSHQVQRLGILPRETPPTLHGHGGDLGREVPITHPSLQLGVVSVSLKGTSLELNLVSKGTSSLGSV